MVRKIFICLLFFSCGEAGTLSNKGAPAITSSESSVMKIDGRVGIGSPVTTANLAIIDVSDSQNSRVIASTVSNEYGAFNLSLDGSIEKNSQILLYGILWNYKEWLVMRLRGYAVGGRMEAEHHNQLKN